MADDADEVPARRGRDPDALGQPAARPARRRRCRRCTPARWQPAGPDDLDADLPDGADPAGGLAPSRRSRSPSAVREAYKLWRPTPLYRARRLERALDTPAHIYYKYEGVSPAGSHKPNTAVAAGLRERAGRHHASSRPRPAPASGARRWPSPARCSASSARSSWSARRYDQKPYRRSMMETWGATVHRSPSRPDRGRARAGRRTRPGSLGIAISEAVEVAAAERGHQLLARLGAQPRAACTRR